MQEIFVNLTCVNRTSVYSETKKSGTGQGGSGYTGATVYKETIICDISIVT